MPNPNFPRNQYNALLHAIWAIDRELQTEISENLRNVLERDRQALTEIFTGEKTRLVNK